MARRPFQVEDFIGQKEALTPVLRRQDGAISRGEPLPHHLFAGASGLGKSLAAKMLANRAQTNLIKVRSDLPKEEIIAQLQSLKDGDFVFLDEAHQLNGDAQEALYMIIDKVAAQIEAARNKQTRHEGPPITTSEEEHGKMPAITLIFATDQPGRLNNALLKRIPETIHLRNYSEAEMTEIIKRVAAQYKMLLSAQSARQLAAICNGIPRRAEQRVNDVLLYFPDSQRRQLEKCDIANYLKSQRIDPDGIGPIERSYLAFLAENEMVSVDSMAAHLGIDAEFVRSQIEQPLRYRHLIVVTSSGRKLTNLGKKRAL